MSTQGPGKLLLLDLIGFEERSRSTLEMAISNRAKGRCVLAHSSVATAVLVDIDHAGAPQIWEKYRDRYPGRLAIFTSLYEGKQPQEAPFLKKPIAIEQFIDLLDSVARQSSNAIARSKDATSRAPSEPRARAEPVTATRRTVRELPERTRTLQLFSAQGDIVTEIITQRAAVDLPTRELQMIASPVPQPPADVTAGEKLIEPLPDIDCTVPEEVASRTHTDGGMLLHMLKNASKAVVATRKAHRVKIGASNWVTFAADGNLVWTNLEEECFDALVVEAADANMTVVPCLPDEEKIAEGAAKWRADSESILWRTAAATYRGKLPPGTDPEARVYLARWPNLTRVLEIPNAVRIAALWAEQRLSLAFTAEILRIPQRYVFAFYGAAHAAGLCGPVRRSEDVVIAEAPVEPDARRGLFAKILGRLLGRGV